LKAVIKMNETNNSLSCERASDLIAFLYNEATPSETRDFELHLKDCGDCRQEVASFGLVRESITAWRDEALSGFVSTPVATTRKSALAALRQFIDLSPLWLKGATAFAVVVFCVLAALAIVRVQTNKTKVNTGAVYTEQDVNRIVKEALAKQGSAQQPVANPVVVTTGQSPKPKMTATHSRVAKSRRPLSRAEREQLAADLRLLSTPDDAGLNLVGDRINQ
jgi:anti-sigma factor RsiW